MGLPNGRPSEVVMCLISTRYKSTFFSFSLPATLASPKHVENSKGSLFNVRFPAYRGPEIFQFDWRGEGVGETVGRITVVMWVWYQ